MGLLGIELAAWHWHALSTLLPLVLLLLLPTLFYSREAAANEWALCRHHLPAFHTSTELGEQTVITADEGLARGRDIYEMSGDVNIMQAEQQLQANRAIYYKTQGRMDAYENVRITTPDAVFHGDSSRMWLDSATGTINNAQFQLRSKHARGDAEEVLFESESVTVLKKATYTTCDPGRSDWLMHSSKVRLDRDSGIGSAQHALFRFMYVPFFYLPYISFPIDDRRMSGILPPAYRKSDTNGVDFSLPYYLNLAPHRDMTVTPRYIEKRGTVLNTEFRYLNPKNRGTLNLEYLSRDRIYEQETGEGTRGQGTFTHSGNPAAGIQTNIDLSYVSDPDYLAELGNTLTTTSITHLQRSADISYLGDHWNSKLRVQSYQTIDETIPEASRPYKRLPQITFSSLYPIEENSPHYGIGGEYVYFDRTDRLTGGRLNLQPKLSFPFSTDATYLTPAMTLQHTRYELNRLSDDPLSEESLSRTLPLFTVDSGLFLERDVKIASRGYLQTLEPRLFYLYVPYRNQVDLPIFDSGTPDLNFTQLFSTNRFSGVDRVGDTNQITAALTTRFIDQESGTERLTASIGQIYYLKDRRTTLAADSIDMRKKSDIVAQSSAYLRNDMRINADYQWDVDLRKTARGSLQFRYNPAKRRIINLGYRYRNLIQEQVDVSLLWPLPYTRRWHFVGRWTQSLLDETTIEAFAGLEYQTCCWKLNIIKRRFLNKGLVAQKLLPGFENIDPYDRSIFIQLELKGMGKLGKAIDQLLEGGIL